MRHTSETQREGVQYTLLQKMEKTTLFGAIWLTK